MHKTGLKILLGWVLFLPITAYSLGLGDLDVKSFLNQPLRAEISIISARPGEIDDLLVGLANREAFARASLSRPSHLNELKFKVVKSEDGTTAAISVKTQTAVKEPVLNFLVEADWAKGKVFREFTILLDPPYFAQQAAKPVVKAKPTTAFKSQSTPVSKKPQNVTQPKAIVNQTAKEPIAHDAYANESRVRDEYNYNLSTLDSEPQPLEDTSSTAEAQGSISITDGVTLWSVAKSLKTDNASMSQIMLALQRLNQDAFGKNNINNLKQGSVLRVPSAQDITEISQRQAYAEVLNQNGLWNDYLANVGHASVNASNTQVSDSGNNDLSSVTQDKQGALSIVASGEGDSDKAALRSDDVQQISNLRKKLLLSEEDAESVRVERDELASRVKMLEAELAKRNELQNLVNIQDDNLATMEQKLSDNEPAPQAVENAEMDVTVTSEAAMAQENNEENVVEIAPSEELVTELPKDVISTNDTDVVTAEPEIIIEDSKAQAPVPIIVSEPSSSSSIIDNIIQAVISNPLVQGAIAIVLLLILLAAKFLKGGQSKSDTKESNLIEDSLSEDPIDTQSGIIIPNVDDEDETPINVPQMEEDQPVDEFASTLSGISSSDDEEDEDEFSKTAIISAEDMSSLDADADELSESSEALDDNEEQDETLDEVDVYLAYSLFENAEDLLKEKLVDSPERADYRAKLLDTYFATQNAEAFADEASSLKDLGHSAEKYWPKVQTMGFELDSSNPMFAGGEGGNIGDLAIAKPEVADFDIGVSEEGSAESEFDLSLDGDDTNFDLSKDADSDNQDLEFNLDDDLLDNEELKIDELPDDLGGLDFDLDDSEEMDESPKKSDDAESSIDDGLEFILDDDVALENEADAIAKPIDNEDDGLDFSIGEIEDNEELDINIEDLNEDNEELDINIEDLSEDNEELDINVEDISEDNEELDINIEDLSEDNEELDISVDDIEPEIDFSGGEDLSSTMDEIEEPLDANDELLIEDEDAVIDISDLDDDLAEINIADELDENDTVIVETIEEEAVEEDIDFSETEVMPSIEDFEETSIMGAMSGVDETSVMSAAELMEDQTDKTDVISVFDLDDELDISDDNLIDGEDITDIGNIEGLMLPDDVDEVATKLDLAKAFQDMGDSEGARSSLEEVLQDGNDAQKLEAEALLKEIAE